MISRREFTKKTSIISICSIAGGSLVRKSHQFYGINYPVQGPSIKKISIFPASGSFYRFIGPNSYDEKPKGIKGNSRKTILIELSDGTTGLGTVGYKPLTDDVLKTIKNLIGKDIFSLYDWQGEKIIGVNVEAQRYFLDSTYSWIESAVLDALGNFKKSPVWQLFGDSVRDGVDPYDGTVYFADIANNTDARIIGTIGKRIKRDGYGAVKIKVGRPDKWLPGEAGVERDIEAFIAMREAVGNNFNIMTDANNGYRNKFDWAIRFLKACAPYDMHFMEELIPDDAEKYAEIRDILMAENTFIPIADGESIWEKDMLETFTNYCKSGVYSYIQPDIPTCGFTSILRTARMAESYPHVKLIPHVWQSQMGLLMSAHIAKIQTNIPFVEDSRYNEHALMATNYKFDGGKWYVPDEPGWGVKLSPGFEQFIEDEPIVIK